MSRRFIYETGEIRLTAVAFALALWLYLGVVGIALAMGIDWTVKAALDLLRYRGGRWRGMKVI